MKFVSSIVNCMLASYNFYLYLTAQTDVQRAIAFGLVVFSVSAAAAWVWRWIND